jgi:phosphomannomutase
MLTASHMPYQNNGMKFFTAEGGLAKPDITEILTAAAERAAAAGVELGDDMQVC